MHKSTFFTRVMALMTWLCAVGTVMANPINEHQALNIATSFMSSRNMKAGNLHMIHKAPRIGATATDKAAFYVFNADASRGGYVIVAGDDRAPAVLGYSDKGNFDAQNVSEALQELLEGYTAQIEALANGAKAAPKLRSTGAVTPLIKATWSQNNPYNILLPFLPSGKHAHAGCVATAMAQVMYYWQWPARPTQTIPAYTSTYNISSTETLTFDMPALPVIDFNWNAMHDTYQTTDTTSEAALAAATLTLYCAQAVEMNFKPNSSGANTTSISCKAATYFDYDAGAHMAARSSYTAQGWADLLYSELSAGRPVIFSGSKKTGGHAFICDGCDGNGMYHFNWGWNGDSNGYFLLSVLNPDEQGTGSASGAYGYIFDQGAIIGFQPNQGSSHFFELTAANVTLDSYIGTRASAYDSFKVYVSGKFHNYTSDTIAVSFGWGLFDEQDVLIDRLYSANNPTLRPGYLHTHTSRQLSFGERMTSGTYRIKPMFSEYNQGNWRPCAGADKNYIEVTINGNECTFTGYGTAAECDYVINDIAMTGYMHNGRPINFEVNMTNNGLSDNRLLYMFNNGAFIAAGYVDLGAGETGNVHYTYLFQNAGNYTLTWSWNEDGSDPIASRTITINPMPAASLSATSKVLNVPSGTYTINSDKFSVELTITNNGQTTYDEDISAKLYKNIYGGTGSNVQGINKRLTLGPGETTTIQLDLDNVIDGWKYFAAMYYYSEGQSVSLARTTSYTMVFPEVPAFTLGDVNNDKSVDVNDVTTLISYILGANVDINTEAADAVDDGELDVADVTAIIALILNAK